jgi:hypothetical protein
MPLLQRKTKRKSSLSFRKTGELRYWCLSASGTVRPGRNSSRASFERAGGCEAELARARSEARMHVSSVAPFPIHESIESQAVGRLQDLSRRKNLSHREEVNRATVIPKALREFPKFTELCRRQTVYFD